MVSVLAYVEAVIAVLRDEKGCSVMAFKSVEKRNQYSRQYARKRYAESPEMFRQKHIRKYGITGEEKKWCVEVHQVGLCPVCRQPLIELGACIDHDHDCSNASNHTITKQGREFGCRACIRGMLHDSCNHYGLPFLEKNPQYQDALIKDYLAGRPFGGG